MRESSCMVDQAEALRRLVLRATAAEPRSKCADALVVITGTRPGVGASTVALHLALRLYRRGWPAGLVELQAPVNHLRPWGGISSALGWLDVRRGARTLREVWQSGPCGLPLVVAGSEPVAAGTQEASALEHDARIQLRHAADSQLVIVDGGTLEQAAPWLGLADHCCIVADEQSAQVAELYAALKRASSHLGAARGWLLINRVCNLPMAVATRQRVISACARFLNLALCAAGELPEDPSLDRSDLEPPWGHPSAVRQAWDQVLTQWAQRFEDIWNVRPRWHPRQDRA